MTRTAYGIAWATALIASLDPPPQLGKHVELVQEAASELMLGLRKLGSFSFDPEVVIIGVIFHDAGKIIHPIEFDGGGNLHEAAGQSLLLSHGAPPELARFCVSHARWRDTPDVTTEDLLVALADRLWKGRRDPELELAVVNAIAGSDGNWSRWDWFIPLDTLFESIAAGGHDRLERSRV